MEKSETTLWVGKLPQDITSTELEKEFSRFGKIFEISMRKLKQNKKFKHFFFLNFLVDMPSLNMKMQRMLKQLTEKWMALNLIDFLLLYPSKVLNQILFYYIYCF